MPSRSAAAPKEVADAPCATDPVPALVVAPPRTLAELRRALPERPRRAIVADLDVGKDPTKHPVEGGVCRLVDA